MLVIRDAQMQAFREAQVRRFENDAVQHLERVLPDRCREMGAGAVRESVQLAIRQTQVYGLDREYDVLRYLHCMCVLGFGFDQDPRYPWAKELLTKPGLRSERKMDLVTDRATDAELLRANAGA